MRIWISHLTKGISGVRTEPRTCLAGCAEPGYQLCALRYDRPLVGIAPGFVKSVRREDTQPGSHVITQYLKTLTVEFYDVDAAASDYLKQAETTGSANTSALHGPQTKVSEP